MKIKRFLLLIWDIQKQDKLKLRRKVNTKKLSDGNLIILLLIVIWTLSPACSHKKIEENPVHKLHNGIELPVTWPPRYAGTAEHTEMIMPPYLKQKPEVININTGRQLFVDDFLIEETNMERICHTPAYFSGNPILVADKEWEFTRSGRPYAAPFSDGVWYDEKDARFKMWYLAGAGKKNLDNGFYTCYAESEDGRIWKKPLLDIIHGTNVVDTFLRDASTVWLDKFEKDPEKRYKFFNIEQPWQYVLKYSSDGIHWSRGVAQSGNIGDRSTVFFNPFTGKWV